jgi:hypothetical protein
MHISSVRQPLTPEPSLTDASKAVPPGLARRHFDLPPGIAKKLEAGASIPRGIAQRFPQASPEPAISESILDDTGDKSPVSTVSETASVDILA